jgi:hypothetical protein
MFMTMRWGSHRFQYFAQPFTFYSVCSAVWGPPLGPTGPTAVILIGILERIQSVKLASPRNYWCGTHYSEVTRTEEDGSVGCATDLHPARAGSNSAGTLDVLPEMFHISQISYKNVINTLSADELCGV